MSDADRIKAATERGVREGMILWAQLRHRIQFQNLQRGAEDAERIGVFVPADEPRSAASNLVLGTITGARTSFEAQ